MYKFITILILFCSVGMANAGAINLHNWAQKGDKANGNWKVSDSGSHVTQTINGLPTYYVSNKNYMGTKIGGTFKVGEGGNWDNDFVGFVFGYNSPDDCLLFDWKQSVQGDGLEGFTLSRIKDDGDGITEVNYGGNTGDDITVLASDYGDNGWEDNTEYEFSLEYTEDNIIISIDGNVIFDVDGVFADGKFGFYNYSQEDVRYRGWEEDSVSVASSAPVPTPVPTPEPSTYMMLSMGVVGFILTSKKRRKI